MQQLTNLLTPLTATATDVKGANGHWSDANISYNYFQYLQLIESKTDSHSFKYSTSTIPVQFVMI